MAFKNQQEFEWQREGTRRKCLEIHKKAYISMQRVLIVPIKQLLRVLMPCCSRASVYVWVFGEEHLLPTAKARVDDLVF